MTTRKESTTKDVLTFRVSPETLRQVDYLAALWGENRSAAIIRAIQIIYSTQKTASDKN